MKLLHISDTHGKHKLLTGLPVADIIIHSGDVGMIGTEEEVIDFLNWFLDLPYRYKIFVPGNHDDCLMDAEISGLDNNCFILCNKGIDIEGIKIYGVPAFTEYAITGEEDKYINLIPNNIDILVTHQPPYGILDYSDGVHYGAVLLLKRLREIKPKFHLFGHIHDAYGIEKGQYTLFSNSSVMDNNYQLKHKANLLVINTTGNDVLSLCPNQ